MSALTHDRDTDNDGQFDDAVEDSSAPLIAPVQDTHRDGVNYIDDDIPESEADFEHLSPWDEGSGDEVLEGSFEELRVEDEDWEIAERDFTKQYNRLKQHAAVRSGNAQGATQAVTNHTTAVAALPAINRPRKAPVSASAPQPGSSTSKSKYADQLAALSKYSSRISQIDTPYQHQLGVGVNRKGPSSYANMKDKSDRATSEQVLDPRTRLILFKMIGRGLIHEINGCVSTGKEANVYHAITPERRHLALKIYKTSILVFKDRDRYVSGEHRFSRGYSRHNPRKMVRVWAEKEMRNLKRLANAGIPCPEALEVRENVLVMTFLGDKEGWASPRLKDADIPAEAYERLYHNLVLTVRKLFHTCRLVHADLSEYNIIYHNEELFIIDVSQSVEHDHPNAFNFLRKDLRNVEDYFGKYGSKVLGLRRIFDFVTQDEAELKKGNENASEDEILQKWLEEDHPNDDDDNFAEGSEGASHANTSSAAHEDSVFMKSYIPRNLNDLYDPERDAFAAGPGTSKASAGPQGVRFADEELSKANGHNEGVNDEEGYEEDGASGSESEGSGDQDDGSGEDEDEAPGATKPERPIRGHRHEDKEARKERKKAVKEEARERRKHKMPKNEKKKRIKASRH